MQQPERGAPFELTEEEKVAIREMLRDDVPLPTIVERLGLPDADLIYEAQADAPIRNREGVAEEKWRASVAAAGQPLAVDQLLVSVERLLLDRGPLRIIDFGCGTGGIAHRLAERFPDCHVLGVDLIESHLAQCRKRYVRDNLTFQRGDAIRLAYESVFDVGISVNVLEHVDDVDGYLATAFRALKDDGVLLLSFPVLSYWNFWGWPRWLACKLLGRKYLTHARDPRELRWSIERLRGTVVREFRHGLFPPRRLYYYVPTSRLKTVGAVLSVCDRLLQGAGITFPYMFVFFEVARSASPEWRAEAARSRCWAYALPAMAVLLPIWMASNVLLTCEVLAGRRTMFSQC